MHNNIGEKFTDVFKKYMPDSFVFALILTILVSLLALLGLNKSLFEVVNSWYDGFWMLLEFGMQMTLLIITGYSIALSPLIKKGINSITSFIKTPKQVYFFVIIIGVLLSMISWGWIVIAAVFARELALRVKGVHYPYLIACVYFSNNSWVTGLSSSIPLLLNTKGNYMIEGGIIPSTISTLYTLGSTLNVFMLLLYIIVTPLLMVLLIPKKNTRELKDMLGDKTLQIEKTIKEEAADLKLSIKALSDSLNNNSLLPIIIVLMGGYFISYHFYKNGFDLNLNIMIFTFIILGLLLHKTPMRYSISIKRASSNISGILFQFPFYAGIMGIMTNTGLGKSLAGLISSVATIETYPFFSYLIGGIVNFAIPSGGGEYAVIGPSVIEAVKEIGANLSQLQVTEMIAKASLSIAYGESLTNLLQPFYLLLVIPIMGAGIKIQARDVMGYLVIPFLIFFILQSLMVVFIPLNF
ncbi:short-chain fatty acid transporter [Polaribacter tangerinus]|uniref:short-chain fatty acid transporter n=1 Tax=Polaribacter tangerinus TaxID=1920034 RepID=UPI000B4BD820|nr:TIGR00366 family protein [Polaribacter tangerinus]